MRRALVLTLIMIAPAHAYPLLAPRPVANAIGGAADANVASAFYNPAGLGPLRGLHFWLDGGARIHEGSIQRNDDTKAPDSHGKASINYTDFDAFMGFSWDLGTDTVTLGLSTMVPFDELASFGDSPVRYHSIDQTFVSYQQSFTAAVKLASRLFVGAAFNISENWMRWRFARDAALSGGSALVDQPNAICDGEKCGFENPLARETVRTRGFGVGCGFSIGVLGRAADRLWLGASYISHYFSCGGGDEIPLQDEVGLRVDTHLSGSYTGNSSVRVYVPDIVQAGLKIELSTRLELESNLRWIHYGERSQLDVHAEGGNLNQMPAALQLPPSSRRDLGLQDTFGAEVSLRINVNDKLRLAPSIFFETSAVEASAVSAAALDAPKLDLALLLEWRPVKHLTIGAHAGLTSYFLGDVLSRNNPQDSVDCVDGNYAVDVCHNVISGAGLPSASGSYTLFTIHLGAALGLDY